MLFWDTCRFMAAMRFNVAMLDKHFLQYLNI